MTLLDREGVNAASGVSLGGQPVSEAEAEQYGEYIVALTGLVVTFHDPQAARGMALIGIQTSRDAQQFLAAQGPRVLPLLDSVYVGSASSAPAVVKTWGYALQSRQASPLSHADSIHVVNRLLASAVAHPIAFSSAARTAALVDAAPALEQISAQTKDPSVAAVTRRSAAQLRAVRQQQPTAVRIDEMGFLLEALCANPATDRARCGAVTDSVRVLRRAGSGASVQQRMLNLTGQMGTTPGLSAHETIILQDAARDLTTRRKMVTTPAH